MEMDRLRAENRALRHLLHGRTEDLLRARKDLNSLDQMKQDFISLVAHELRTPITSVVGLADLIRHGLVDSEAEIREHAGDIFDSAARLNRFVDDVILFLEWTSGRLEFRKSAVDLEALVAGAVARVRQFQHLTSIECSWNIPAGLQVVGDAAGLVNCLARLVDNAFKFSHAGGRVEIEARVQGGLHGEQDSALVVVRDQGVGIPAEKRDSLYKVLTLCHPTWNHTQGRGLGLCTARAIALAHGGSVEIDSPGSGQGCIARLTLPVYRAEAARDLAGS